jgi:predicted permease
MFLYFSKTDKRYQPLFSLQSKFPHCILLAHFQQKLKPLALFHQLRALLFEHFFVLALIPMMQEHALEKKPRVKRSER